MTLNQPSIVRRSLFFAARETNLGEFDGMVYPGDSRSLALVRLGRVTCREITLASPVNRGS